jgi:hypothetical protein
MFLRVLEVNFDLLNKRKRGFEPKDAALIDLSRFGFAGLPSFIIAERCIDTLIAQYDRELGRGPNIPIDLFVRREIYQKRLRAGDTRLVLALLRYSYFIDADIEGRALSVLDELYERLKLNMEDPHRIFLTKVLMFILSNSFKSF